MFSISLINYVKNLNHTQKIYNLILKKNIKLQHQPINLFFGSSKKEEAKNQMILVYKKKESDDSSIKTRQRKECRGS